MEHILFADAVIVGIFQVNCKSLRSFLIDKINKDMNAVYEILIQKI